MYAITSTVHINRQLPTKQGYHMETAIDKLAELVSRYGIDILTGTNREGCNGCTFYSHYAGHCLLHHLVKDPKIGVSWCNILDNMTADGKSNWSIRFRCVNIISDDDKKQLINDIIAFIHITNSHI